MYFKVFVEIINSVTNSIILTHSAVAPLCLNTQRTMKNFYSGECRDRLPLQQDFIGGEKDQGYSRVGDEFRCHIWPFRQRLKKSK